MANYQRYSFYLAVLLQTTVQEFAKLGFKGAEPMAVMFEYFASGKYDHDIELTRKLNPKIRTFEQWVTDNRTTFETEFP